MSENNPFEIIMQEKLDGFRIEPAASDWQAIYERLHPRNKRRIIWWWLPLVAALGAGIFWTYHKNGNINPPAAIAAANPAIAKYPVTKEKTETSLTHANSKNTSHPKKLDGNNALTPETSNNKTNQGTITASLPTPLAENNVPVKNSTAGSRDKSSFADEEKKVADNSLSSATQKNLDGEQPSTFTEGKKLTGEKSSALPVEKKMAGEKSSALPEEKKLAEDQPSAATEEKKLAGEKLSTTPEEKKFSEASATIPVKKNIRRWQWAAYLGAGPNYPSEPIALGPTALAVSAPDYSSGNTRTFTNSSNKNGWHFNAGIMAEKKLGKNWLLETGIGVNTNTWKTTIEKYKDSVFSGSLQSRYKLSSEQQKYQLWMVEIPLQFSNRIAGKKAGSLWWTIGLNNQFTLSLKQQIEADSLQGSQLSDSRSLTSSARFYQPQLRLGLMYNHDGRVHWQLMPLLQYTLAGVYSTDPADNPLLVNLQLQYRLFFQGKKEAKRSKK